MLSQVVLSFGIPFALIPLVWFTSRRDVMGALVNSALDHRRRLRDRRCDRRPEHLPARPAFLRLRPCSGRSPGAQPLPRGGAARPTRGSRVVDVPDPVVELELLQRCQYVVAGLHQRRRSRRCRAWSRSSGSPVSRRNGSDTITTAATAMSAPTINPITRGRTKAALSAGAARGHRATSRRATRRRRHTLRSRAGSRAASRAP